MKFEVVECGTEWIVRRDGVELARFDGQLEALAHIAGRLRDAQALGATYSLAMRYASRS